MKPWKTLFRRILQGGVLLSALVSCVPVIIPQKTQTEEEQTRTAVNYFAANCLSLYYLWAEEVRGTLNTWISREMDSDPVAKVESIRYKERGVEFDRWTILTDDFESFTASVDGVTMTYGCDIILKQLSEQTVCAIITVVYAGSPAEKAGLKRGDTIVRINGQVMTLANYYTLVTESFLYSPNCTLTLLDPATGQLGKSLTMSAVKMYEDPIICHKVFEIGGKRVGYLAFTSFTLDAIDPLIGVFEGFRLAGVSELILDLRYNGGGYVTTEEVLASMLAPKAAVDAGAVFEQEVYNRQLTEFYVNTYGEDALKTFFKTEFSWGDGILPNTCYTGSGHLELDHLYAIVDEGTASASESLLVGLRPYLDITLIGAQTHGKFCTGILYGADEWYDDYREEMNAQNYALRQYADNWGLYLMVGRYADKDGHCAAMPAGLTPDYPAEDLPESGYALGDEREEMLRQALILAGRDDLQKIGTRTAAPPALDKMPRQVPKPAFGLRIRSLFP